MSFTMASVRLLAPREGTNRCPRSFFRPASFSLPSRLFASPLLTPDLWFQLDHLFTFDCLQPFRGKFVFGTLLFDLVFIPVAIFMFFFSSSILSVLISTFYCINPVYSCFLFFFKLHKMSESACSLFCLTRCSFPQYLTTVIPYEKKAGTPSVEDLQILAKSEFFSAG